MRLECTASIGQVYWHTTTETCQVNGDDGDDGYSDGDGGGDYQSSIKCGVSSQRNLCHFFGS